MDTADVEHGELTCAEMVTLVTEYLEGALPPDDAARFEQHARVCPECGDHIEQMRLTVAAVGRLREEDIPAETQRALLGAFRDWKRIS